jgi:hypothetical protein
MIKRLQRIALAGLESAPLFAAVSPFETAFHTRRGSQEPDGAAKSQRRNQYTKVLDGRKQPIRVLGTRRVFPCAAQAGSRANGQIE